MFGWFKKQKEKKQIKQNLDELKKMILSINIPEKASKAELDTFYEQVNVWDRVINEKEMEFNVVMSQLSAADKIELVKHIDKCIGNYGRNMVKLNDTLINYLEAENILPSTKVEIVSFGRSNMAKSDETIESLKNLAGHIVLNK